MAKRQAREAKEAADCVPPNATPHGIRMCADWLHKCLRIGWKREDLDQLQRIWWEFRDPWGNLRK